MSNERIVIDAWGSNKIENYDHVFKHFGLDYFDDYDFIDHYLFKRKIVVAQRDFGKIKKAIETNSKFLQLTGIASSGDFHFGHKLDVDLFLVFKKLGAKSKFCICDIDAYVSREDSVVPNMERAKEIALNNVADVIALGVDPEDIYVQSKKEQPYYQLSYEISKKITKNMFEAIYGHINLGKMSAVLLQIADILHMQLPFMYGKAPSITGIGLDQDPHARITRDVAKRVNYDIEVPSFLYFSHQSGLKEGSKMSSSDPLSALFLKDSPEEAKKKINRAFTGGCVSLEEQKEKGGNPDICKIFEIYKFHNPDDEFVERTNRECRSGKLLCGECKKNCVEFVSKFLIEHNEKKIKALESAKKIVYG